LLDDDLKRIATRIRTWRDEAGLTLQQLGDQAGVSASTIHKIENLQTVPTIAILLKVANGLNRRPSELLADADVGKQAAVLHSNEHRTLTMEGRAKLEHLVGTIPRNRLDVWRVQLEPGIGAGAEGEAWQFHGEVILLVEDGELECEIENEGYKVCAGDSIHFDTSLPHRWYASGGRRATVVVSVLLPERLQADLVARMSTLSSRDDARLPSSPSTES
jgi:transcriptional regulator with XRE-family HTH domain